MGTNQNGDSQAHMTRKDKNELSIKDCIGNITC